MSRKQKRWTSEAQILDAIDRCVRLEVDATAEAMKIEAHLADNKRTIALLEGGSMKRHDREQVDLLRAEIPILRLELSKANKRATRYEARRLGPLKNILAKFNTALLPGETDEAVVEK